MRSFNRCYPDANNFDNIIKLKELKNWTIDYVELSYGIGYWIAENPFENDGFELIRELIANFPIQKDNSHVDNPDPNPFDTVHLPEWSYKKICFFIRDFYSQIFQHRPIEPQIHEWGNIYYKKTSRPVTCWRIPHIDYQKGLVANLWFTDHEIEDSSTKLYKYHGNVIDDVYDFQVDTKHKMHDAWRQIAENPQRAATWFNFSDKELQEWGFECVGAAPTREKTMTLYKADTCHTAFISTKVDFRWSHTYAYSFLEYENLKIKDIFKL